MTASAQEKKNNNKKKTKKKKSMFLLICSNDASLAQSALADVSGGYRGDMF